MRSQGWLPLDGEHPKTAYHHHLFIINTSKQSLS